MPFYQDSTIRKFDSQTTGNAAVGVQINVKNQDGTLANIFSDSELTIPKSNPFGSDQDGFYHFHAETGVYNIEIGSPVDRTLQVVVGNFGDLPTGVTLLSNNIPNSDWLERNNQTVLVADYPNLAGTPGYPIGGGINGYTAGADYNSGTSVTYNFSFISMKKSYAIDSSGTIYSASHINGSQNGSFLYSNDNGVTDQFATTANTITLNHLSINESAGVIFCVGNGGRIEVFDLSTKTATGNDTVVTGADLTYSEYDSNTGTYICADLGGGVFTGTDPLALTQNGTLSTADPTKSFYYTKTKDGYLIFNEPEFKVYFVSSLLGSPAVTDVTSQLPQTPNISIQFNQCCNLENGKTLLVNKKFSNNFLCRSLDSGQNWTTLTPNGFTTADVLDMKHIDGDVWVIYDSNSDVYYTLDAGDNWTQVDLPATGSPEQILVNQNKDLILIHSTSDIRTNVLASTSGGGNDTFTVSSLASPNATDFYIVKGR